MPSALRPYVTAGIALVGASVISVTPIAPTQLADSGPRVSTASVDLVASVSPTTCATDSALCKTTPLPSFVANGTQSAFQAVAASAGPSIFNVPANLLIALANVPYNLLTALGNGDDGTGTGTPLNLGSEPNSGFSFIPTTNNIVLNQPDGHVVGLTADLNYAGNIWVYSPTNVLGTDPGDIGRYEALVNVFLPFPALSVGLGNILASVAASLLPMNVGCTGTGAGACNDPGAILSDSLNFANVFSLFSPNGYTFPVVKDPITCSSTGQCDISNPDGPTVPQSGQNVKLDLSAPFTNFYNSLTQTPDFTSIKVPTLQMVFSTFANLLGGFNTFLNPFVLGTQCGLCALVVPNPDNLPVPGPTNPGTTAAVAPSTTNTTLASTFSAKQDEPANDDEASSSKSTVAKKTVLDKTSQSSVTTGLPTTSTTDPTDPTDPVTTPSTPSKTTPGAHRVPGKSFSDAITKISEKLTGGGKVKADTKTDAKTDAKEKVGAGSTSG